MLAAEGVRFRDGKLAGRGRVYRFGYRKDDPMGHGVRPKKVAKDCATS